MDVSLTSVNRIETIPIISNADYGYNVGLDKWKPELICHYCKSNANKHYPNSYLRRTTFLLYMI